MKIWAIMGPSNVGKTETIKLIENYFSNNKESICIFHDNDKNNFNDIICVYEINNQFIGLISIGDFKTGIEKDYNVVKTKVKKLDYLICASRTTGKTIEYVQSLSNDIIKIRKSYLNTNNQDIISKHKERLNMDLAKYVYENIIDEIKKRD